MRPEDLDRRFAEFLATRDLDGLLARRTVIDIDEMHAIVQGDLALIRNRWTSRTLEQDGRVRESSGSAIEVARRQLDGRWLFVIDDPFGRSRQ